MPSDPPDDSWKAPREDAQTLIWPAPAELLVQTQTNLVALQSSEARIQNVPLPEVRRQMRQWIGHLEPDKPIIATGHQTELYHVGVWVKNVLINCAAAGLGGAAYHVAVDTDSPKHLRIKWPGGSEALTDDAHETSAEWSGLVAPPTPAHLQRIESEFRAASSSWPFQSLLPEFLLTLRRLTLEDLTISATVANALHQLDWDLGLRHHTLLASPLWQSEPFALLVHHVCSRADEFARHYNDSLTEYRQEQNIANAMRPMPDLHAEAERIEIPFWLDDLSSGSRERAEVHRAASGWQLELSDGETFLFDAGAEGWTAAQNLARWLRQHNVRLSPRALTLMMFLRLCLVDQFVHGIGGARYDHITDKLMRRHFQIEPPKFCVTTATLYFPTTVGRSRACLPCIKHEGHQIRHRLLGYAKMERTRAIARLPRYSAARSEAFRTMRREINDVSRTHPAMIHWMQRMEAATQRSKEDEVMFDRELFYALQSRTRLNLMIGHFQRSFEPV